MNKRVPFVDRWGNRWERERFNGFAVGGVALSLLMFAAGYPMDEVRRQQKKEEPIGGWDQKGIKLPEIGK